MLDIDEMSTKEMHDLLQKVGHGHLLTRQLKSMQSELGN